jgi:hypothetical protein
MRIYSVMFAPATVPLSLASLRTGRGAAVSFAAGGSGRHVTRFIEIVVFAMLLALIAFPAPARAQTFTMSSAAATPATVQPGKTVTFTDTITANQNASNYNVLFSLLAPGAPGNITAQTSFPVTFKAGAPVTEVYSWTAPASANPGTYTFVAAVFNPTWSQVLGSKSTTLTIATASTATYPTLLQSPVVSGTAQVGKVLSSTTGTWTGATSFAYQWSGNKTAIPGATAATYIPTASDVGHTLTSTVVATGSPGAVSSAISAATVPIVAASAGSPPPVSGSVPFVALHTYYMSPTGSDSNNGLAAATAWASPNHPLNCGDVIIAASGAYGPTALNYFGKVSNCPSTTGGIDGTGGIWMGVLLCGSTLGSCTVDKTGPYGWAVDVTTSNWAVEGWVASTTVNDNAPSGFAADGAQGIIHHVAFINDIAYNVGAGFAALDNGTAHDVPGASGYDYTAVIGSIAQNAQQWTQCTAEIVFVAPATVTSLTYSGTHFLMYGNFAWNTGKNGCATDEENYMFDTFDAHGVTSQSVIMNNIGWSAYRMGIQFTFGNYNSITGLHDYVLNNTEYNDNLANSNPAFAELNVQQNTASAPYIYLYSNIAEGTQTHSCPLLIGGNPSYTPASLANVFAGATGQQNVLYSTTGSSTNGTCYFNGYTGSSNVNYNVNPAFTNTSDLLASRSGAPNCAGFTNTTACMGWNASTGALTTPSVISDLTPTCGADCAGAGYQKPSTTCVSSGNVYTYYPTWLKGIVYLQWNGSSLTENSDLVTKPCKM